MPVALLAVIVVVAALLGALLGFGSGARYRSEAVFSISRLEGDGVTRPELRRIADDLVVVSSLPSVRQEVRRRVELPAGAEFEPDVGVHEEAEGVVRFTATHADADTARELALALATVSVEFLVDGRSSPADDPLSVASRAATDAVLADQALVTPDSTVAISLWPAFARSAVVAAVVSLLTGLTLVGLRSATRTRTLHDPHLTARSDLKGSFS
ncbi:MAG: hypothetical protein ACRBI6_00455 [Acidimicrobiales bacterium]